MSRKVKKNNNFRHTFFIMSERFDYDQFKAKAIEQLKSGVPLSGKDGILAPLLENLLNSWKGRWTAILKGESGRWGTGATAT